MFNVERRESSNAALIAQHVSGFMDVTLGILGRRTLSHGCRNGGGKGETDERVRLQGNKEASNGRRSERQTSSGRGGPGGRKGSSGSPRSRRSGGFGAIRRSLPAFPRASLLVPTPPSRTAARADRAARTAATAAAHAGQLRDRGQTEPTHATHRHSHPFAAPPAGNHASVRPRAALPFAFCPFCGPRCPWLAGRSALPSSRPAKGSETRKGEEMDTGGQSENHRHIAIKIDVLKDAEYAL
jgi:hypothetical protein